jgi:hypothetical protein
LQGHPACPAVRVFQLRDPLYERRRNKEIEGGSMQENSNQARVARYINEHPEETYTVISRKLGIGYSTLARIAALYDIHRPSGKRLTLNESLLGDEQSQKE